LAFDERLAHKPELKMLKVAQTTVNKLGGGRRGAAGEIVLLEQHDAHAASGGIPRDAAAVDAAADDRKIEHRPVGHSHAVHRRTSSRRSASSAKPRAVGCDATH